VKADASSSDLYVYDVQRHQELVRLTVGADIRLEGGGARGLAWQPDGRYLFFTRGNETNGTDTLWVRTEGLTQPHALMKYFAVSSISRDGTHMFASAGTRATRRDAFVVRLSLGKDGPQAGPPEPLLHEKYSETPYYDSPDGRWLSYSTDETGILQTYVVDLTNPSRKLMVSSGSRSGHQAFWSPSGREIFFTSFFSPLRIMVSSFSFEDGVFHAGQPHSWSPVAIPNHAGEGASSVTMAPDGKRFAVLMPVGQPLGNRVTFVMNFSGEIRRRIATGR